jgi:hypothetical protein
MWGMTSFAPRDRLARCTPVHQENDRSSRSDSRDRNGSDIDAHPARYVLTAPATTRFRRAGRAALGGFLFCVLPAASLAQSERALGVDPYLTFAGNFDIAYHQTQFFVPNHNAIVGQWDTRAEIWLPPFRREFSWGPYIRITGIAASQAEAWENAWLGGPGVGFQVYPFSLPFSRRSHNHLLRMMGPLRLFGEYNRLNYWGQTNQWRPHKQTRFGAEHWRALHVNDVSSPWWAETWNGLWWQSANEFSPAYHTWIFANAARAGVRAAGLRWSAFTPYIAVESSRTDNGSYYWENRLLAGGGVRYAPSLKGHFQERLSFNRFAVYAEYLHVGAYYSQTAPSSIPAHEVRAGITFSTGQWYPSQ